MPLTLDPGTIVDGRYRIERVLGEGGMGVVVVATHLELGRQVALKLLRPELAAIESLMTRFRREARAIASLHSDHTVRVFDVSRADSMPAYIAMEYLRGHDLSQRLVQGSVSIMEAVDYIVQACASVAEAHILGVVHRDLKPANLFLARASDGTVLLKVLDFGISKVSDKIAGGSAHTVSQTVMGTPTYMSPEQLDSRPDIDGRTDIWTLGVILFELLTGALPFEAPTLPQLCMKITQSRAPAPSLFRSDVPVGLDAVIARCLQKDPARRFATALDLAGALAEFGGPSALAKVTRMHAILRETSARQRSSSAPPPLANPITEREAAPTQASWVGVAPRARRRRAPALGLAIGAAGLFALFLAQRQWPTSPRHARDDGAPVPPSATMFSLLPSPASATAEAPNDPKPPVPSTPVIASASGTPIRSDATSPLHLSPSAPIPSARVELAPVVSGTPVTTTTAIPVPAPARSAARRSDDDSEFGGRK